MTGILLFGPYVTFYTVNASGVLPCSLLPIRCRFQHRGHGFWFRRRGLARDQGSEFCILRSLIYRGLCRCWLLELHVQLAIRAHLRCGWCQMRASSKPGHDVRLHRIPIMRSKNWVRKMSDLGGEGSLTSPYAEEFHNHRQRGNHGENVTETPFGLGVAGLGKVAGLGTPLNPKAQRNPQHQKGGEAHNLPRYR